MSTTTATQLPTEKKVLQDEQTGATIWQLTNAPCVNHAPYFLNPAWAGANHDMLIITSYRAGAPNLYGIQLPDGTLRQLTTSGDVSAWSACVSPDGKHVYYAAATQLRAVDTTTLQETVLTNLPPSSWLGNCSISPDGSEILLAAQKDGKNIILAVRTDGGGERVLFATDQFVAHAQWSPDGRTVLFSSDMPRMWLVEADGSNPRPLRAQRREEWITHEAWLSDDEIIFTYWPHALKAIRRDGSGERDVAAFNCWHPAPRRDGAQIVCDTTLPDGDCNSSIRQPATARRSATRRLPRKASSGRNRSPTQARPLPTRLTAPSGRTPTRRSPPTAARWSTPPTYRDMHRCIWRSFRRRHAKHWLFTHEASAPPRSRVE